MLNDRWGATRPDALCLRAWDDEDDAVVYNRATGETHRISALGHALLDIVLSSGPRSCSLQDLTRQCTPWFETDAATERERFIHETLRYLEVAGLVARQSA